MAFADLASLLPRSRISTEPAELAANAGDWSSLSILAQLAGEETAPAAVLQPASAEDVAVALRWASDNGVPVLAAGGRSGVSGGVRAHGGELLIDLRALVAGRSLDEVIELDERSGIARVPAGVMGSDLEAWLNGRGYTLGHFPQSIELSTVGGWVAARSAGQLSCGYGAVEDFVVGLRVALPDGTLAESRLAPRTAAGPQLHQLFIGSEGTLGVVLEAWLRVRPVPPARLFASLEYDSFETGLEGVRRMAHAGALPSAVRVYDDADVAIAFRNLEPQPVGPVGVLVAEGDAVLTPQRLERAVELAGGRASAHDLAGHWWEHRNDAAHTYRRVLAGELLGEKAAVDTIEVAGTWLVVPDLYEAVRTALRGHALAVGCHCSHAYETGCALYFTFVVQADDRAAALTAAWASALDAALAAGGTMTHHHGVGQLKNAWLARELGGFAPYLDRVRAAFDPAGVMNPRALRA